MKNENGQVILYIITLVLLISALIGQIFFNDDFTIFSMLNTDGLAIIGVIIALINLILSKIHWYKSLISHFIIALSKKKYNFNYIFSFVAQNKVDLIEIENCVKGNLLKLNDSIVDITALNNSNNKKIFTYGNMVNVEISKYTDDITIKVTGDLTYNEFEMIILFFMNTIYDEFTKKNLVFKKISLNIKVNDTFLKNMNDIFFNQLNLPKSNYVLMNFITDNQFHLGLNSESGVSLSSTNRADFIFNFRYIKSLLVI